MYIISACCKTWTGPWTGLVNYGLVKHGLVKPGLVKLWTGPWTGLVKHGLDHGLDL